MEIIYVNCGLINGIERDLRSNEHHLSSDKNKAWKINSESTKFRMTSSQLAC